MGEVSDMAEIWDPFLTDDDRQDCDRNPVRDRPLGVAPALLMVDCYKRAFKDEIRGRDGRALQSNRIAAAGARALPRLVELLANARDAAIPIVHTTKQTSATFGIADWNEPVDAPAGDADDDFEFVDELSPAAGEAIVMKTTPSSFLSTPLLAHLMRLGVDTVVVAGESTSGCVRASVVDARAYGFRVAVVADCTFDRHDAAHAINLFDMHRKYARLLTLDDAVRYLRSGPALGEVSSNG